MLYCQQLHGKIVGQNHFSYCTRKNVQVVTDLQTIKLQQGCNSQADIRMCSHCLFPVVVTSLEQVVIALLQG
jgi:hypothetical protein